MRKPSLSDLRSANAAGAGDQRNRSDADALKRRAKLSDGVSIQDCWIGGPWARQSLAGCSRQAPIASVWRAEKEAFLHEGAENPRAVLDRQREQAGRLFDGRRKAAHLHEFPAHASDHLRRRAPVVERAVGQRFRHHVEWSGKRGDCRTCVSSHHDLLGTRRLGSTIRFPPANVNPRADQNSTTKPAEGTMGMRDSVALKTRPSRSTSYGVLRRFVRLRTFATSA